METTLFFFYKLYLNYANIAWTSTKKSKLEAFYRLQKYAAHINFKDKFTSANHILYKLSNESVWNEHISGFMYLCRNGNTPSIFTHIYTLKRINKYTTTSKNILFKPLCKKNLSKFKLSYHGPHLWNIFIAPNNDLLEAVTIRIFKIQFKKIIVASTKY